MTPYDQIRALLRADEPAVLRAVADYLAASYTPEQEDRQAAIRCPPLPARG